MGGRVHAQKDGALGWIVFDHPERRNAISVEMWRQIPEAVAVHAADPDVRVVILRGAGEVAFVSGADISQFESQRTGQASEQYDVDAGRAYSALTGLDKPLLAMIHGFCIGGGLALALTADVRYAAEDGRFGIPAARLGVGYGLGGIEALAHVVGPSAAKEVLFTAKRYTAQEALRMGLVNALYPKAELEESVRELATLIAANAPLTVRAAKKAANELLREPARRDLAGVEAAVRDCFQSDDYREGVRAFLEKRPPRFQGR